MNNEKCIECKNFLYGKNVCSFCGRDNSKTIMPKVQKELKTELKWRKLKENKLARPFLNGTPIFKRKKKRKINLTCFIKTFLISFIINMIVLKVIQLSLGSPDWYSSIGYFLMWSLPIIIAIKRSRK